MRAFDGLTRPSTGSGSAAVVVDAGLGALFVVVVAIEVVRQPVPAAASDCSRP